MKRTPEERLAWRREYNKKRVRQVLADMTPEEREVVRAARRVKYALNKPTISPEQKAKCLAVAKAWYQEHKDDIGFREKKAKITREYIISHKEEQAVRIHDYYIKNKAKFQKWRLARYEAQKDLPGFKAVRNAYNRIQREKRKEKQRLLKEQK
jgi:hypothetical protein